MVLIIVMPMIAVKRVLSYWQLAGGLPDWLPL